MSTMPVNLWERYGPYSKKKERKRRQFKEESAFIKSSAWLKWRVIRTGGISYYFPSTQR